MGDLAKVGLGGGHWPSDYMISLLEFIHVSTNLPWWASIVILTIMLRITIFPIVLKTTRNSAIVPYIINEQKDFLQRAKEARESNELMKMKKVSAELMDLYRRWGYNPMLNLLGLVQIPIFLAMFRTCWRCSKLPVPGWQDAGVLWFHDLTVIDPYFILPAVSGVTTAVTIFVCLVQWSSFNFSWHRRILSWNQRGRLVSL